MADLIYLPKTRQKYLYLLIMVDIWSNNVDFEPLKDKKSSSVLQAMKKIFKCGILPQASIRTDNGLEFQDVFHKWLYNHNIFYRFGEPYRHQQVANVERLNYELSKILNGYMNSIELKTGEVYREWTDILDFVRKELNKDRKIKPDEDPLIINFLKLSGVRFVGLVKLKSELYVKMLTYMHT